MYLDSLLNMNFCKIFCETALLLYSYRCSEGGYLLFCYQIVKLLGSLWWQLELFRVKCVVLDNILKNVASTSLNKYEISIKWSNIYYRFFFHISISVNFVILIMDFWKSFNSVPVDYALSYCYNFFWNY